MRYIYENYCGKGEKLLLKSNFSSYPQYFYLLLSFYVRTGTRISLRDKRLFKITEVEIARVDCIYKCLEIARVDCIYKCLEIARVDCIYKYLETARVDCIYKCLEIARVDCIYKCLHR